MRGMAVMAAMAAMAARQVMVRSERIVVCRLWSLMLIRRKRVGVRQCGGEGEGGRAGAGESSGVMRARAMMATMAAIAAMAGDSERQAQREDRRGRDWIDPPGGSIQRPSGSISGGWID